MTHVRMGMLSALALFLCTSLGSAQQMVATASNTAVPPLVSFSGALMDLNGKPLARMVGITFYLYKEQQGGAPLWMETQNVQPDKTGHYTILLGSTTSEGLPASVFATGAAHWLGVQVQGQEEQPRVLLVSAPYAMKAADAETVGGLPASAFALAAPAISGSVPSPESPSASNSGAAPPVGGSGTADYIPLWTDNSGDLGNSILYQTGSGSSARIGINTTSPLTTLDVKGTELVRGLFEMATMNYASPTKGYDSQPFNLESSAYNSQTKKYTLNHFQWQAEPIGNNTNTPGATLNLLYGTDPASPSETGLSLNNKGQFTFASGQTFPGTGTITSVTAGTDLTGGGTGGNVTLNLDTTKVPQLNTANSFTGNQTVNGNLSATGVVTGSNYQIGSNLFAFGSYNAANALLGFSGNTTMTGGDNTAVGYQALSSNISGNENTATGANALNRNTTGKANVSVGFDSSILNATGSQNTAVGFSALYQNVAGSNNTAIGSAALEANTSSDNTAVGTSSLLQNTTGSRNTAIGRDALYVNTTGTDNTATGYDALFGNTGAQNTADGSEVLFNNTTGGGNTGSGYQALYSNTGGISNTANGFQSLYYSDVANGNTATGYQALLNDKGGGNDANTADGISALIKMVGSYNTAVGAFALSNAQSGFALTCIGYACIPGGDGLFNATAIGAFATVGESNALVLGSTGEHAVKVGIGTTTPSNILTIARGAGHPVSDSWETYSSRRWKTNIKTLPDALSKVEHLRGVSYDLKDSGKHEIGVIAEEVGAVVPEIVSYEPNGKDASGVDYSRLTALLIEAVKQQQKQIAAQQKQIAMQAADQRGQAAAYHEELRRLRSKDALVESKLTQLQQKVEQLRQVKESGSRRAPNAQTVLARARF